MANSNFFGYSYFSGANVFVKIAGIPALETAGISYQVQESTAPIYGYSSRIFDAVALGQKIIKGNLIINFIQPNYLAQTIHLSRSARNLAAQNNGPSVREQLDDFANGGSFSIRRAGSRLDSELANIESLQNYRDYVKAEKEFTINLNKYAEETQIALKTFQEAKAIAEEKAEAEELAYESAFLAGKSFPESTSDSFTTGREDPFVRFEMGKTPLEQKYLNTKQSNNLLRDATSKEYYSKYSAKNVAKLKEEYEAAVAYFEENSYDAIAQKTKEKLNSNLKKLSNAEDLDSVNAILARIDGLETASTQMMSFENNASTAKSSGNSYINDIGLLGPFNIDIQFAEEYTIRIMDAFLTSRGSMIQIDENAIVEEYGFFARDIKYL